MPALASARTNMAEILGLGLSHYPGPVVPTEFWPQQLRINVEKGRIPREIYEDRATWPAPMLAEWGTDDGRAAAERHYERLIGGFREIRKRLDEFAPDIIVVWGDDQYENFREDCVPPFCLYIFDELASTPLQGGERGPYRTAQNAWALPPETKLIVRGHREAALGLTHALMRDGFDPAYAFSSKYDRGLSHAFANTVLYLDYDRAGFDYPVIPFHVNCFGSQMMKVSGGKSMACPPSPSPRRCFEIGAATAKYFAASPWRVALIGSSSWSHGTLTKKHHRMFPDVEADQRRLAELRSGNYGSWQHLTSEEIEDTGQSEFLNWVCLAGAMAELGHEAEIVDYVESYIFNSSKCFAAFSS